MNIDEQQRKLDSEDSARRRKSILVYSVSAGIFTALCAVYFYLTFSGVPEMTLVAAQNVLYLIVPIAAATAAVIAWRTAEHEHRGTMLNLSLAMIFIVAGELAWTYYTVSHGGTEPPHPSLSDILYLGGYVFLTLLIVSMARLKNAFSETRIRHLIDVLLMCLFGAIVIWSFSVRAALLEFGSVGIWDKLFMTIFPILDFGLVFGISINVVGFKRTRWRPWEILIAVGLVVTTFADVVMAYMSASDTYFATNVMATLADIGWMTEYFLFFVAALSYLMAKDRGSHYIDEVREVRLISKWRELFVYVAILGTIVFFVFLALLNNPKAYDAWVIIIFSVILISLIITRAFLFVSENNKLVSTSLSDPLTGVHNYRYFQTRLDAELERARRYDETLSIAVIDLDNFGQVNKVHGHSIGDHVLKAFAKILRDYSRLPDSVCRVGGDEFAVILPQTQPIEAVKVCLRAKQKLSDNKESEAADILPGFSCGVCSYPAHGEDKETLLKKADIALHWAKFHGRDQVLMFEPEYMEKIIDSEEIEHAEQLAYLSTIQILAATVDARDPYTLFHSKNVARLASQLAKAMELEIKQVKLIETAALLHDVGKIGVPDSVLLKAEKLSEEERDQIKEHAILSAKILSSISMQEILPWIAAHHEKWDGTGYPEGLERDAIPLEARILAICDAYDAMTSDRCYRKALSAEEALRELVEYSGAQFDPDVVAVFILMLDDQDDDSESA